MDVLYGINNCDTVKKARRWLDNRQMPYRFHDLRRDGLDAALLHRLETALGWETLLNRKSTTWRNLAAEHPGGLLREQALALLQAYPTLLKRPILERDGQYVVGYDPEFYSP